MSVLKKVKNEVAFLKNILYNLIVVKTRKDIKWFYKRELKRRKKNMGVRDNIWGKS